VFAASSSAFHVPAFLVAFVIVVVTFIASCSLSFKFHEVTLFGARDATLVVSNRCGCNGRYVFSFDGIIYECFYCFIYFYFFHYWL